MHLAVAAAGLGGGERGEKWAARFSKIQVGMNYHIYISVWHPRTQLKQITIISRQLNNN